MFWTNVAINILLVIYVLNCAFMGLVIMMQRSKQEGLGAAFGGGFTESIWGAQTSQVLVKATAGAAVLFFVLSIALARLYSARAAVTPVGSTIDQGLTRVSHAAALTNAPANTTNFPAGNPALTNHLVAPTPSLSPSTTAPAPVAPPAPKKTPTH